MYEVVGITHLHLKTRESHRTVATVHKGLYVLRMCALLNTMVFHLLPTLTSLLLLLLFVYEFLHLFAFSLD